MDKTRESLYAMMWQSLKDGKVTEAEQMAVARLREVPIDAEALKVLGKVLLIQGYEETARKALRRANLFRPQKQWSILNKEIQNIKPSGRKNKKLEEFLKLKDQPSVTAAILVKNEERCIQRCLNSLIGFVDHILVVDTGSTDNTLKILQTYPQVEILSFPWKDDFAEARNFALSQIKSDWVIWMDADEYIHPEDGPSIKEVASLLHSVKTTPLLHPVIVNQIGDTPSISTNVPRMFPFRGDLRYYGRIHEQIVSVQGDRYSLNTQDYFVNIRILHDGYDPQKVNIQRKLERNIHLLMQMVQEEPNDPTWLMYLGREMMSAGDIQKGISLLLKAEKIAKSTPGFGALLEIQRLLIQGFLSLSDFDQAENICERMINTDPSFPDAFYYMAYIQVEKGRNLLSKAEQNLQKAKKIFPNIRAW